MRAESGLCGKSGFAIAVFLCWVVAAVPAVGLAAPAKAAQSLARQAKQQYDNGDMARAASLYYDAWVADKSQAGLLFSAALAARAAGQLDRAKEWLESFLALKEASADPARLERAKAALREISRAQAIQRRQEADKSAADGDWPLAAGRYQAAYRLDPDRQVACLYLAAIAFEKAGEGDAAKAALERYLATAPEDAEERPAARAALQRVQAPKVAGAAARPAPDARPKEPDTVAEGQRKAAEAEEIRRKVDAELLARRAAERATEDARKAAERNDTEWEGFYATFRLGYQWSRGARTQLGGAKLTNSGTIRTDGKHYNYLCTKDQAKAIRVTAESAEAWSADFCNGNFTIPTGQSAGFVTGLQFGYNILGQATLAAEVSGMGLNEFAHPGASGAVAMSVLAAVHPVRWFGPARRWDLALYVGVEPVRFWYSRDPSADDVHSDGDWYRLYGPIYGMELAIHPRPNSSFAMGLDLRLHDLTLSERFRKDTSSKETFSAAESSSLQALTLSFVLGSK